MSTGRAFEQNSCQVDLRSADHQYVATMRHKFGKRVSRLKSSGDPLQLFKLTARPEVVSLEGSTVRRLPRDGHKNMEASCIGQTVSAMAP